MKTEKRKIMFKSLGVLFLGILALGTESSWSQIPNAPAAPTCTMNAGQSNCRFKQVISGTPTSVVGNRVVLFDLSTGGHTQSRLDLRASLGRLSTRYGFNLLMTQLPTDITVANLTTAKVFIMSNGDGDRIPLGANRTALENFQQVNGWGVLWVHAACAFISTGWPFGQNSCVQQYFHHDQPGTQKRMFIDSGTTASPNHGRRNAQTEFLVRSLPGWGASLTLTTTDEWYCFRAPARNTAGVNVLFGYDRSFALPTDPNCPEATLRTEAASQNHSMAWTRMMGAGITVYNSWGHDVSMYTGSGNMGDSLLWRYLRYAAKDWELIPVSIFNFNGTRSVSGLSMAPGTISLSFSDEARNTVSVTDVSGKQVFSHIFSGVRNVEIPNLKRGLYFVKVISAKGNEVKKVSLY